MRGPRTTSNLYFSSILPKKHPQTWSNLENILKRHNISFTMLQGTKDIWARDYSPIPLVDGSVVQFQYTPSYLRDMPELQTDPRQTSDVVLDGGNVVSDGNGTVIVTDRIFSENKRLSRKKEQLVDDIKQQLQVDRVVIVPADPEDFTGHSDGMMRHLEGNRWLLNRDPFCGQKKLDKALRDALRTNGIQTVDFPYFPSDVKVDGDYTAIGCYINFIEIGDVVILPLFGEKSDDKAIAEARKIFSDRKVETVLCRDVALKGGVLNCICSQR